LRKKYICVNGKIHQDDELLFQVNRAMKYGDGLFETIRVIDGSPYQIEAHFKRLKKGMDLLSIDGFESLKRELPGRIDELIQLSEIQGGGRIRLTVYRQGAGTYSPLSNENDYFIEAEELEDNFFSLNSKGMKVDVSESETLQKNTLSEVKTLNRIPQIRASIERDHKELDELILCDNNGNLSEAISSNIFIVKKDKLYTPSLDNACMNGVMRSKLIQLFHSNDIDIQEGILTVGDLLDADELFLSNSIRGIQWVGAFRTKRFFNTKASQYIELLNSTIVEFI
jgi:branched-chain amino acid aminotransferase